MKKNPAKIVTPVRLDGETIARLKALGKNKNSPKLLNLNLSALVRAAIDAGLDVLERAARREWGK